MDDDDDEQMLENAVATTFRILWHCGDPDPDDLSYPRYMATVEPMIPAPTRLISSARAESELNRKRERSDYDDDEREREAKKAAIKEPWIPVGDPGYTFPFDQLPMEMLLRILEYMTLEELLVFRSRLGNSWWFNLLTYNYPWIKLVEGSKESVNLCCEIMVLVEGNPTSRKKWVEENDREGALEALRSVNNEVIMNCVIHVHRNIVCGGCGELAIKRHDESDETTFRSLRSASALLGYLTVRCVRCILAKHDDQFRSCIVWGMREWRLRGVRHSILTIEDTCKRDLYGRTNNTRRFLPHVAGFYRACHRLRARQLGYTEETFKFIDSFLLPKNRWEIEEQARMDLKIHKAAKAVLPPSEDLQGTALILRNDLEKRVRHTLEGDPYLEGGMYTFMYGGDSDDDSIHFF